MTEQELIPALADDVFEQMMAMVTGHWVSQTIRCRRRPLARRSSLWAAADGGRGGRTRRQRSDTTFRLMRACVALGLLTADAHGRFTGTPLRCRLWARTPLARCGIWHWATTQPSQWLPLNGSSLRRCEPGRARRKPRWAWASSTTCSNTRRRRTRFSAGVASTTAHFVADAARVIDTTGVKARGRRRQCHRFAPAPPAGSQPDAARDHLRPAQHRR